MKGLEEIPWQGVAVYVVDKQMYRQTHRQTDKHEVNTQARTHTVSLHHLS